MHFIEKLLAHITNLQALSDEVIHALGAHFTPIHMTKQDYLVRERQVCRHLYFLEQGAIRGYYLADGREITHWFAFENDFVTSFYSFHTQQPAVENIQLIENSMLWRISKSSLQELMNNYHEVERTVRLAYEQYYMRLEEKFVNSKFVSATHRYQQLIQRSPQMVERVALGHIASYLGISQETLSRIRSKF